MKSDATSLRTLRELTEKGDAHDSPFDELGDDAIGRLDRLAADRRFSWALREIELLKSAPLNRGEVPKWDENDFNKRYLPNCVSRVDDAIRCRRNVHRAGLGQGRIDPS